MSDARLKISELARLTGVSAKAIRFYEAVGALPPPVRAANGYRLYGRDAVDVLRFIARAFCTIRKGRGRVAVVADPDKGPRRRVLGDTVEVTRLTRRETK